MIDFLLLLIAVVLGIVCLPLIITAVGITLSLLIGIPIGIVKGVKQAFSKSE